ncbi:cellular retinoic acid-binding protein 2-like [Tigriopus californicus]|uniref:cellular retinoic acid-binding protein 2-like n=1 Tax=Tigriopus californicus TaxID=6832 RepID=UPI0027DA4D42|nr:cellular retinoic acid-binding protein 2-like [Tigriopus californicus]
MASHKVSNVSHDHQLFQGIFKLQKMDNWAEYLRSIGQSEAKTKVSLKMDYYNSIVVKSSGKWILSTYVKMPHEPAAESKTSFYLDDEFEESVLDGRACLVKFKLEDGNKLVAEQRCCTDESQSSTIIREFLPDRMNVICICGQVQATGVYVRCSPEELHHI